MSAAVRNATKDPPWVRALLIGVTLAFLGFVLLLPLATILQEAFKQGAKVYFAALVEPEARHAL